MSPERFSSPGGEQEEFPQDVLPPLELTAFDRDWKRVDSILDSLNEQYTRFGNKESILTYLAFAFQLTKWREAHQQEPTVRKYALLEYLDGYHYKMRESDWTSNQLITLEHLIFELRKGLLGNKR